MAGFDTLGADQQAVLQLVLKQGKSYGQIAGLLRLEEPDVRRRALAALDALGAGLPGVQGLGPERREELGDHLLGQQDAAGRTRTRAFLEGSAPGRAWARGVAAELEPHGALALPEVPVEPPVPADAKHSSRLGGAVLLSAVLAALGIGLFLLLRDREPPAAALEASGQTAPSATTSTGATGATGARALPQQQINLEPPPGRSASSTKALAYAVIAEGALAFQAEGLRQKDTYDVWLYNSPRDAISLGDATFDPTTKRLAGVVRRLPAQTARYGSLVITRQTKKQATTPGKVVLRGAIRPQ